MGALKPIHHWDMIGYIASAHQLQGFEGEELREKTFSTIKSEVTEEEFLQLISEDYDVRKEVFEELTKQREAFAELYSYLSKLEKEKAKSTINKKKTVKKEVANA